MISMSDTKDDNEWALVMSAAGSMFGYNGRPSASKRTWRDYSGTERLVFNPPAPNANLAINEEQAKRISKDNDDLIPDGMVLTQGEMLALPIHNLSGAVQEVRETYNHDQIEAALRSRRDVEAAVLIKLRETGAPVTIPKSRHAFRDLLEVRITEALTRSGVLDE